MTLPLTPVEHFFTGKSAYPITFVFPFASVLEGERLQGGLSEALKRFPWVAGRLARRSENELGLSLDTPPPALAIRGQAQPFAGRNATVFVAPVTTVTGAPLAHFCLSQTDAGSVLGVSVSHAIADGHSFFHFLGSWARLCRGEPVLAPTRAEVPIPPCPASAATPQNVLDRCGLFWAGRRVAETPRHLRTETMTFENPELARLRSEVQRQSPVHVSDNDLVAALLWRELVPRWAPAAPSTPTFVTCPVDYRNLVPGLGPTHFGCAVAFATARLDRGSLLTLPLWELATVVRRAIDEVNATRVAEALGVLNAVRESGGLSALEHLHVRHPSAGLIVTNLTRAPLADLDFGAGPPVSFWADAQVSGGAALFASGHGIEARVYLPAT
jgi:shikimate O-hydroxycinnamoyltransferase